MYRISFYINEMGELISATERPGRPTPLEVPLPLEMMNAKGTTEAERNIGELVLHLLNKWHPDAFKDYSELQV